MSKFGKERNRIIVQNVQLKIFSWYQWFLFAVFTVPIIVNIGENVNYVQIVGYKKDNKLSLYRINTHVFQSFLTIYL